jgi:hypothetical protein
VAVDYLQRYWGGSQITSNKKQETRNWGGSQITSNKKQQTRNKKQETGEDHR